MSMSRQLLGRVSGLVSRRRVSASPALADKVTHTGQLWGKDDPRNARFTGDLIYVGQRAVRVGWLDLHEGGLGWGLGSFKLIPYFLFSDRPGEAGEQPVGH